MPYKLGQRINFLSQGKEILPSTAYSWILLLKLVKILWVKNTISLEIIFKQVHQYFVTTRKIEV